MSNTHTHTASPVIHRVVEPRAMIRSDHDTCIGVAPQLIKLMGYDLREDAMESGGSKQCQIHTHTHTQSVHRDTHDGWSLEQRSNAILTHVSVAPPLIKLMGYEHREDAMGGGGSKQCQIHTHTHTHTECLTGWMEPRAKIGHNLDTCMRGPPLIELMGHEYRGDAVELGRASNGKHPHTHTHTQIQCPS